MIPAAIDSFLLVADMSVLVIGILVYVFLRIKETNVLKDIKYIPGSYTTIVDLQNLSNESMGKLKGSKSHPSQDTNWAPIAINKDMTPVCKECGMVFEDICFEVQPAE